MIRQIGERFARYRRRHQAATVAVEMRDWPKLLRLNAAAVWLASKIHEAEREIYGGPYRHWDALAPETKRVYVRIAEQAIEDARADCHGAERSTDAP